MFWHVGWYQSPWKEPKQAQEEYANSILRLDYKPQTPVHSTNH